MKRLFVCGAALSLLVAPALSIADEQQQHNHHGQGGGGGGHPPAARPAPPRAAAPRAPNAQVRPGASARPMPGQAPRAQYPQGRAMPGRPAAGDRPNFGRGGGYRPAQGNRFFQGGRYHDRVRGGAWAWPRGYGYRRFYVGGILPAIFLSSAYMYSNWAALGLAPPPYGFVWVRYGPDMVMVNQATGQIADVAYDVFL